MEEIVLAIAAIVEYPYCKYDGSEKALIFTRRLTWGT
jgi:hypothetical protein